MSGIGFTGLLVKLLLLLASLSSVGANGSSWAAPRQHPITIGGPVVPTAVQAMLAENPYARPRHLHSLRPAASTLARADHLKVGFADGHTHIYPSPDRWCRPHEATDSSFSESDQSKRPRLPLSATATRSPARP